MTCKSEPLARCSLEGASRVVIVEKSISLATRQVRRRHSLVEQDQEIVISLDATFVLKVILHVGTRPASKKKRNFASSLSQLSGPE